MHSSTRAGAVALVGNQEEIEYYRNDSPEAGVSKCSFVAKSLCWMLVAKLGVNILKYCRREEEKRKETERRRRRREFILLWWGGPEVP